jgi:hypothetical protein
MSSTSLRGTTKNYANLYSDYLRLYGHGYAFPIGRVPLHGVNAEARMPD